MIYLKVTEEQLEYSQQLVSNYNFGNRGEGDGDKSDQHTGMLGQVVVADFLNLERPTGGGGWDGGWDLIINEKKVDVKTSRRRSPVKPHYTCAVKTSQLKYNCDYYIFTSYNTTNHILTICGVIEKEEFKKKAQHFNSGELIHKDDSGKEFRARYDQETLNYNNLLPINNKDDLLSFIV